jgi:hypothetical protein
MDGQAEHLPFVQLELAGSVGLDEARYLAREPDERVLVVRVANAPPPPRRRLRRRRPRRAEPGSQPRPLPVTRLTVIGTRALGTEEEAKAWLESVREDGDLASAEIETAVVLVNRAIAGQRAAGLDPHLADVSAEGAEAVRIGYGPGVLLAEGRWEAAVEIPRGERKRRVEVLRPQETIAAVLAGRERIPASVTILLRARADLDAGRSREAALQLRVGLDSLLAEAEGDRHEADLAALGERREATEEAAREALRGELSATRVGEVADTLTLCERVLRRRRAAGG